MKLRKICVENFKCIENSKEFDVDDITCLLGKNEAGKSAILQALYKLNPIEPEKTNFLETEFPRRHVSTYRERKDQEPANVLTTVWELSDDDINYVKDQLGAEVINNHKMIVTKGYGNIRNWEVSTTEKDLVKRYLV